MIPYDCKSIDKIKQVFNEDHSCTSLSFDNFQKIFENVLGPCLVKYILNCGNFWILFFNDSTFYIIVEYA